MIQGCNVHMPQKVYSCCASRNEHKHFSLAEARAIKNELQGITHRGKLIAVQLKRARGLRCGGSRVRGLYRAAYTRLARFAQPVFSDVARVIVTCHAQGDH